MMYLEEISIQNIIEEIDTVYGNQDSEQEKKKSYYYLFKWVFLDKIPQRILRSLLLTTSDQSI